MEGTPDMLAETERVSSEAYADSPMVRIVVGQGAYETNFFLYERLLEMHRAHFVEGLGGGSFEQSHEKIVRLPREDPVAFGVLFHCIYRGQPGAGRQLLTLITAYMLADRLSMPTCMNLIHDAIRQFHQDGSPVGPGIFASLRELNVPEDSQLTRFYVEKFAHNFLYASNVLADGNRLSTETVAMFFRGGPYSAAIIQRLFQWRLFEVCWLEYQWDGHLMLDRDPSDPINTSYHVGTS